MKARPILFSAPMVRALLDGRKTQTRRILKGSTEFKGPYNPAYLEAHRNADGWKRICPYGQPGDLLWVRETFADVNDHGCPAILYKADGVTLDFMDIADYLCEDGSLDYDHPHIKKYHYSQWIGDVESGEPYHGFHPSIHMPRWASRLTLELTGVRVERLQDISREDAIAEGIEPVLTGAGERCGWLDYEHREAGTGYYIEPTNSYESLWDSINGSGSSDANPWVWVLEFRVHQVNVDELLKRRAA
ncbi:hypothetical protein [Tautonia marina]|uniref:hypothetical protein n=1 Tax=Tautonia marina TaxID=2653855 RepID=UPI001260FBE9|nr:hypothetical protein [Tautonia marina]